MSDMSSAVGPLIGPRIRRLRKAAGFESIEAFARELGYSWITVSRYERGKSIPSIERLGHIADVLGVDLDELLKATA